MLQRLESSWEAEKSAAGAAAGAASGSAEGAAAVACIKKLFKFFLKVAKAMDKAAKATDCLPGETTTEEKWKRMMSDVLNDRMSTDAFFDAIVPIIGRLQNGKKTATNLYSVKEAIADRIKVCRDFERAKLRHAGYEGSEQQRLDREAERHRAERDRILREQYARKIAEQRMAAKAPSLPSQGHRGLRTPGRRASPSLLEQSATRGPPAAGKK